MQNTAGRGVSQRGTAGGGAPQHGELSSRFRLCGRAHAVHKHSSYERRGGGLPRRPQASAGSWGFGLPAPLPCLSPDSISSLHPDVLIAACLGAAASRAPSSSPARHAA